MPEAITKYAINSTLGTENFQPLDQLIISQTRIVASEDEYAVFNNLSLEDVYKGTEEAVQHPQKIKMIRPGTINLTGTLKRTVSLGEFALAQFRVYKNGLLTATETISSSVSTSDFSLRLSFNPYDIFTFELYLRMELYPSSSGKPEYCDFSVSNLKICGKMQPNIFIEV